MNCGIVAVQVPHIYFLGKKMIYFVLFCLCVVLRIKARASLEHTQNKAKWSVTEPQENDFCFQKECCYEIQILKAWNFTAFLAAGKTEFHELE
jgi:hypothetical protein